MEAANHSDFSQLWAASFATSASSDEDSSQLAQDNSSSACESTDDDLGQELFNVSSLPDDRRLALQSSSTSRVYAPQDGTPSASQVHPGRRQDHSVLQRNRMDFQRIQKVLNQSCPCERLRGGKPCLRNFSFANICELRFARSTWGPAQEYQARQEALQAAAAANASEFRLSVNQHLVCLTAYCMIYDYNCSSMRRSWSAVKTGLGIQPTGRPRGSHHLDPVGSSTKNLACYSWMKEWLDTMADVDPVGLKYKFTINYVGSKDLYQEYAKHYLINHILLADQPLSHRRFAEIWQHFKQQEKVRVRKKANTTTKCVGKIQFPTSTSSFFFGAHTLPPRQYVTNFIPGRRTSQPRERSCNKSPKTAPSTGRILCP